MRHLILDYEFEPETRTIILSKIPNIKIENIRLIVNETQKFVICSSMQKDLITSIESINNKSVITYSEDLPTLKRKADDKLDVLTIEVDMCTDVVYGGGSDVVIESKINGLQPQDQHIKWKMNYEFGKKLKPLAENPNSQSIISGTLAHMFNGTCVESVDLSSWTTIQGDYTCNSMFMNCKYLKSVDLSNLTYAYGQENVNRMFMNCSSLTEVDMSNAVSFSYGAVEMFKGCTSLRFLDISNLIAGGHATMLYNTSITEMYINSVLLQSNDYNYGSNPLRGNGGAPLVVTLHIVGAPKNDMHLEVQSKLSFQSVLHVLEIIAYSEDADVKRTVAFTSNFKFYVSSEEKQYFDETFDIVAKSVENGGKEWIIQGLKKENVIIAS